MRDVVRSEKRSLRLARDARSSIIEILAFYRVSFHYLFIYFFLEMFHCAGTILSTTERKTLPPFPRKTVRVVYHHTPFSLEVIVPPPRESSMTLARIRSCSPRADNGARTER